MRFAGGARAVVMFVAGAAGGGAVLLASPPAHAGGRGLSGALWVEGAGGVLPNTSQLAPSFPVADGSSSARTLINGVTPPFGFPMGFVGVRAGLDFVASDRTIIPLMDFGISGIVGEYANVLTGVDGSLVRVSPSSIVLIDADILGIGVRFKRRRWMFAVTLKPGVAFMMASAAVADGKDFTSLDTLTSFSPTLRVDLEVCRRLDPLERACLVARPNVYEWGWGNGGTLALRYEFGP